LKDIPPDAFLEVETQNSVYLIAIIDAKGGKIAIQGSGHYFREPTICYLTGSTWGGSVIRLKWIGVGMYMEIYNPADGLAPNGRPIIVTTSPVKIISLRVNKEGKEELVKSAAERKSSDSIGSEFN